MWGIIQTILISVLLIVIAQYSFQYLKDTLTPRKTKDLAGFHKQKFEEILNELREAKNKPLSEPAADMESELLEFAQEQLQTNTICEGI
jgi:hypothetical protein